MFASDTRWTLQAVEKVGRRKQRSFRAKLVGGVITGVAVVGGVAGTVLSGGALAPIAVAGVSAGECEHFHNYQYIHVCHYVH